MLLIGCPVLHREWILDRWFDHVEEAVAVAGVGEHGYVFAGDPVRDQTFEIISSRAPRAELVELTEARPLDRREWNYRRFVRMAEVRNELLARVRSVGPDQFLSLDSDILLHPEALVHMLPLLGTYGAVGGKCYLSHVGVKAPSWGKFNRVGKLQRVDFSGIQDVEVIMAIKLMSPAAFGVDYEPDLEGEDIGWSRAARAAGVRLGWCGTVISKHVMEPRLLDVVDQRVGW